MNIPIHFNFKSFAMKKTTILPILGLAVVAAVSLTAFSIKNVPQSNPEATFEEFLAQFPQQQLPYSLSETSLRAQLDHYVANFNNPVATKPATKPRRLDWQYYRFLPSLDAESSFSRLPMQAEPIAMFAANDKYAVLYSSSRSYGYGYSTYYIAVLDKLGAQISCNEVGKVMPQTIVSATVSKDLQAELKTWRIEWKKDYEQNGLEGNKIAGLTHVDTQSLDLMKPTTPVERGIKRRSITPIIAQEPNEAKTK